MAQPPNPDPPARTPFTWAEVWQLSLLMVAGAVFIGTLVGLAAVSPWFGRFMTSPAGGALLTVIATGTIGVLAYRQGNRRLEYERERDRLDRAEAVRISRYEEEKRLLLVLEDFMSQVGRLADLRLDGDENFTNEYREFMRRTDFDEMQSVSNEVAIIFANDTLFDALAQTVRVSHHIHPDRAGVSREDADKVYGDLFDAIRERVEVLRNPATDDE